MQPSPPPTYAGFWIRVAATLIDTVVMLPLIFLFGLIFLNHSGVYGMDGDSRIDLLNTLIGLAYIVLFNGGKWQATPGKRAMGIYIMRPDGSPISYARALGRYFAQFLSCLIFFIGLLMVAFTREKTALHDLLCDTRVVYGKPGT